jgi:multiple sugar transport system substrate-binding protein
MLSMLLGATALAFASGGASAQKEYDGVTIRILTRPGPVIAGRLVERGAEFTEATGAVVRVDEVPFADLFQKILTDWATGTNSIDVGVFASGWAVELIGAGYVQDLTDYVANDPDIALDDVAPFFRDFNQKVGDRMYLITVDGDFQMLYYRTDILAQLGLEPPKTWEEYLEVAKAAHGMDMNGDGEADYGSCIFKRRNAQSYYAILSVAANFIQTQGTAQGLFFDPADMTPLVNNAGFQEALRLYKATGEFGPPEELNHDIGDTRGLAISGRCALMIDWGDIGPLSVEEGSKIKDLVGAVIIPGTTRVLNRETGQLEECTPELCPHAIDGVNHTPFAAFGGWSGAINANAEQRVKDAAYDFLSYVNEPAQSNVDVTMGWTGYNPYRISQFENKEPWLAAGFSPEFVDIYLGAIGDALNSPNMAADLRIPGGSQYEQIVLDRELARFLAGEISAEEATANIEAGWNEVTDEFGREDQLKLYRASLGYTD